MKQIIEKLQCVDDCLELADIAPDSQVRELLAEVIEELKQAFCQTDVSGSLPPDDVLMKVIEVLDEYGRDVDVYEYGLPMNLDVDKQEMLQRIKNVISGFSE